MTNKDRVEKLIALSNLLKQRGPSILVHFVPTQEEMAAHPERKCTCKRLPGKITFCYCLCGAKEDSTPPETARGTQ